ncbi:DUF3048 domain-containing protein [Microcella daejeonensis]|uniref:DUF3048 domain-containing protein n=1 Tax=Microcella daejeonensis TaxID=2994971 RepID=A0A9E8S7Q1_9MICO|nr:DUF3048 domain-containing protein [Microcella daejeonensis]WAB80363.1 DUF3048 domain-containing protein [Microcella daejeonensis]
MSEPRSSRPTDRSTGVRRRGASRRLLALVAIATASAVLGGCSAPAPDPVDDARPSPSPSPEYVSTYVEPPAIELAPLTGEPVEPGSLARSTLAAKIDNHPRARPQVGLDRADIVFEELVEGGLTRYVGVWHSDVPAEIGPIRSIRPMDPDIISPLGGIVAYSGGQQRFVDLMRATRVYNAIHGQADTDAVMYRGSNAPAPHNVIVRAPELLAQHADIAPPAQQFAFAADAASATAAKDGQPITSMAMTFGSLGSPSWAWDAASGTWLRSMTGGAPDTAASGARLSAVNIVVMRVPVQVIQDIPTTQMIGGGEAWVSSGGKIVPATWSKPDQNTPPRLVDAQGAAVRLAPGATWVELVPTDGSFSFQ